jgi:GNAT superfamily N-acetyltransferase
VPVDDAILRFAEEPDAYLPDVPSPARRIVRPKFILTLGASPNYAVVARLRGTAADLDAIISEVREIVRAAGYVACAWYLGPASSPGEAAGMLVDRGFVPATSAPFEPQYAAMVLSGPPDAAPAAGVEARLVHNYEEYVDAVRVGLTAAGESEENVAHYVEAAPAYWGHPGGAAKHTHIAFADGQIAGFGFLAPGPEAMFLGGSAVLPEFRRRGVYRALVTSRWLGAVAAGKPALAVHAGAMSRPVLERCGFQEICRIDVLADPTP